MENGSADHILVALMRRAETRSAKVINQYYTRCIPHYRELLGDHWHTGFYREDDPEIGIADQLRMEQIIAGSARIAKGMRVLDVGCGVGGPACHLARFTGACFHGITPNSTQIELARRLARRTGVDGRVTFTRGFADHLPVDDASVDAIVFFESPCHFPDRDRFFREARRVLRPGGRLAGEDWLASGDDTVPEAKERVDAVCRTWAIPGLGTLGGYTEGITAAGLVVDRAVDMRDEMPLLRGFLVREDDRDAVRQEIRETADPVRKLVLEGLLCLGSAAAAGAFTIGRFLAHKP